MSKPLKTWLPMPVTALLYVDDLKVLLAAKESHVFVIDGDDPNLDPGSGFEILANQVIHGLSKCPVPYDDKLYFVAWGGNALQFFYIDGSRNLVLSGASAHVFTYVVDVLFLQSAEEAYGLQICFLTAQNELGLVSLLLSNSPSSGETAKQIPVTTVLPSVKKSMLYCGHLTSNGQEIIVASGTMFGQVLVWKCEHTKKDGAATWSSSLIASFHEHEGSVFGVAIKQIKKTANSQSQIHVASCSDDRTVRVYSAADSGAADRLIADSSVSRTGFSQDLAAELKGSTSSGVNTTEGHISRIWSLRWLDDEPASSLLLSFGEDTTAHLWHVHRSNGNHDADAFPSGFEIDKVASYGSHSGKNIWSSALLQEKSIQDSILYTGAADGRIASCKLNLPERAGSNAQRFYEIELPNTDDDDEASAMAEVHHHQDGANQLFLGLEGSWDMDRVLASKRPEYPPGNFTGVASIIRRPVTDAAYDDEMLYKEEGQFSTDSGFSFSARRNYVYRYQKKTKTITAWFVKPDANEEVDYLFHQVEFSNKAEAEKTSNMGDELATGYHLCVRDHYNASYTFQLEHQSLKEWTLSYFVTGPEKDYTATCRFSRRFVQDEQEMGKTQASKDMRTSVEEPEFFRDYCWFNNTCFLLVTNQGRLYTVGIGEDIVTDKPMQASFNDLPYVSNKLNFCLLAQLPSLKSYSLIHRLGDAGVLVADEEGGVRFVCKSDILSNKSRVQLPKLWSFGSKITFINAQTWQRQGDTVFFIVFRCFRENRIHWTCFSQNTLLQSSQATTFSQYVQAGDLPVPASAVITSACYDNTHSILAIGTRQGQLYVWPFTEIDGQLEAASSQVFHLAEAHRKDTITSITCLNPKRESGDANGVSRSEHEALSDMPIIISVGRDTCIRQHLLDLRSAESRGIVPLSAIKVPFGPYVEGLEVGESPPRMLVWGFGSTSFLCYDLIAQTEVMRVRCGNGHRKWDFLLAPEPPAGANGGGGGGGGGSFIWTQAASCRALVQTEPSYKVAGHGGGHGREIKCIASTRLGGAGAFAGRSIVATAAEDTDIRFFEVLKAEPGEQRRPGANAPSLRCVVTVQKHSAGLTHMQFTKKRNLMVSCGGKEELFIWQYGFYNLAGKMVPQILCIGTCPKATELGDTRITGFDIIENAFISEKASSESSRPAHSETLIIPVVYSDSSLRVWTFDTYEKSFSLLVEATYSTKCLTCMKHIQLHGTHLLVTAASDGNLLLYSMPSSLFARGKSDMQSQCKLLLRHHIHQSSIKSLDVCSMGDDTILVATGGDDNAVAFTRIGVDSDATRTDTQDEPGFVLGTVMVPRAHAAAVNAVMIVNDDREASAVGLASSVSVATVSNDQTVKLWSLRINGGLANEDHGIEVQKRAMRSAVADAACLDSIEEQLLVAGVGMEFLPASLVG